MAINKTAAGTFVVDFRDQNGKRIRKTFPTYKRASDYDRRGRPQFVEPIYAYAVQQLSGGGLAL